MDGKLASLREELDAVLREASRDLGLSPMVQHSALTPGIAEDRLLEEAAQSWVLSAELLEQASGLTVRLSLLSPRARVLRVGRSQVNASNLEVRAIQLLRELSRGGTVPSPRPQVAEPSRASLTPPFSPGRAVLAAHGALVGGYVGVSLEHIGGAGDARLVYPLMTLGAGAGLGASLVIAEEWDVSVAEAGYVWAAGTWSTLSGMLIADAQPGASGSLRYGYGLLGASAGLTLGALAMSSGEVHSGGATLTHSGALLGGFFGGLGEMLVAGDTKISPSLGIGIGMGSGLLLAGGLAPQLDQLSASRVLFVDLSTILGGLAGGAIASPILVGEGLTENENRVWLGSIAAGAVAGSAVGILLTTNETEPPMFSVAPYFDVVLSPGAADNTNVEVFGVMGSW